MVQPADSRDSMTLLAAFGMLAYIASVMTHEALGHGGFCLAAGGHNTMLTAWWETCDFPGAPRLAIKSAGPGLQFGFALAAWLLLHLVSRKAARFRFLLWLYMAYGLLISSGYVAFSGITGSGDAGELVARLHPAYAWRGGLVLLGGVLYFLSVLAIAFELTRWTGPSSKKVRLFRLVWVPYVSAGVLACCTGVMTQAMGTTGLAVAAPTVHQAMGRAPAIAMAWLSSFGAGAGMFGLLGMQSEPFPPEVAPAPGLAWNVAWGLLAATVILSFVIFVGPGLR